MCIRDRPDTGIRYCMYRIGGRLRTYGASRKGAIVGIPPLDVYKRQPYVCLEPWCGRCDNKGFQGEISEKPGINTLKAGEVFKKSYDIIVY